MKSTSTMAKALAATTLLSLSGFATATTTSGWLTAAEVKMITVQPQGNIYVQLDTTTPDLGCPAKDAGWVQLDPSLPHFDKQFSLLTTAHLTKRKIEGYVQGCHFYPILLNTRIGAQ